MYCCKSLIVLTLFDFGLQQSQPPPLNIQSLPFQTLGYQLRAMQKRQSPSYKLQRKQA
ncbi:MAG: hypothetical protein J2P21_18825 [Chloracidobacterium sp.]|nr:hypothetical protein [Chloracidobacterium sp.]